MIMRSFMRAVLVSVALTSASAAFSCPIDLAPCDELSTLHDIPILISLPRDEALSGVVTGDEAITPLQTVLLDHEGDDVAADLVTGSISQHEEAGDEIAVPVTGDEAVATLSREFLWGGTEELVQFDEGPSASLAEPELAVDGYEDR
jgi:hypothetical protein